MTNSYFAPEEGMLHLLAAVAARAVDVRLLTASERTDVRTMYFAARARYATLLAAGVRVWEYRPTMLHAKTLVVDGAWSAVGSLSFDNRGLALDDEATLVSTDPAVGARLEQIFLDDVRLAREVTADAFAYRPWWHRPLERGAMALTRVL